MIIYTKITCTSYTAVVSIDLFKMTESVNLIATMLMPQSHAS
jgi:hypothetical protein